MEPPHVFTTDQWGARPPRAHFPEASAEGIVIHNTQTANRAPLEGNAEVEAAFQLAHSIQNHHMDVERPPFSDTGQHFTISRGGLILEGRHGSLEAARNGMVVRGAHAGAHAPLQNRQWFGIELEGSNLDAFHVEPVEWDACILLCAWLSFWGNFQSLNIEGHKRFSNTDCPGKIMDHLKDLRNTVHDRKVEIMDGINP